jgi:hypothetical protein
LQNRISKKCEIRRLTHLDFYLTFPTLYLLPLFRCLPFVPSSYSLERHIVLAKVASSQVVARTEVNRFHRPFVNCARQIFFAIFWSCAATVIAHRSYVLSARGLDQLIRVDLMRSIESKDFGWLHCQLRFDLRCAGTASWDASVKLSWNLTFSLMRGRS